MQGFKSSFNIKDGFKSLKYAKKYKEEHPDYFDYCGLLTFCGRQGSGKTISAAKYIKNILKEYPKCILVSNVDIKGLPEDVRVIIYKNINELFFLFDEMHNGENGVIFFVDEIQILFNSLLKRGMNISVLETISQQRKERRHIVGTAQVFKRIDVVFREQMINVIDCAKYLNCFQLNGIIDCDSIVENNGSIEYEIKEKYWYFHSPELYESYDTNAIISSFKEFENAELSDEAFNAFKNRFKELFEEKESGLFATSN